jgi:hypothetical protein
MITVMRYLTVAAISVATVSAPAFSQNVANEKLPDEVVNLIAAEEALVRASHERLEAAQKENSEFQAVQQDRLTAALVSLAQQSVKNSELINARLIFFKVLEIDSDNADALQFFSATGAVDFGHTAVRRGLLIQARKAIVDGNLGYANELVSKALQINPDDPRTKELVEAVKLLSALSVSVLQQLDEGKPLGDVKKEATDTISVLPSNMNKIWTRLTGTQWGTTDNGHVPRNAGLIRFNGDGTVTASWHGDATLWSVLPNGEVKLIHTKNRAVRTIVFNDTFTEGVDPGNANWKYVRRK